MDPPGPPIIDQPAPPPVPEDLSLEDFMKLCKVDINNKQIQGLCEKHLIFHWSAFKGATQEKLEEIGFGFGPSALIVAGTLAAIRQIDEIDQLA
ncbi:hypothetical protein PGT21_012499 [Puccinia graminis f. sp. tritici]|uniref:Uncharacterized protein n=1 Tax=Puccinia graminis f. sp. tritici TaxID=56615 RepID=A0A5B0NZN7_PUCGR|nr:hypothetical protein PGTUg99_028438 [Puccinia graminis f. sp. tritici]KAA1094186.1 hypothetical protein PGT21_012499 [Puccinia graminis f. sp. tritici]